MSDYCPLRGCGKDKPGMHADCAVRLRDWSEAVSDTASSLTVEQWRDLYIKEYEARFKAEAALAERDAWLSDIEHAWDTTDAGAIETTLVAWTARAEEGRPKTQEEIFHRIAEQMVSEVTGRAEEGSGTE